MQTNVTFRLIADVMAVLFFVAIFAASAQGAVNVTLGESLELVMPDDVPEIDLCGAAMNYSAPAVTVRELGPNTFDENTHLVIDFEHAALAEGTFPLFEYRIYDGDYEIKRATREYVRCVYEVKGLDPDAIDEFTLPVGWMSIMPVASQQPADVVMRVYVQNAPVAGGSDYDWTVLHFENSCGTTFLQDDGYRMPTEQPIAGKIFTADNLALSLKMTSDLQIGYGITYTLQLTGDAAWDVAPEVYFRDTKVEDGDQIMGNNAGIDGLLGTDDDLNDDARQDFVELDVTVDGSVLNIMVINPEPFVIGATDELVIVAPQVRIPSGIGRGIDVEATINMPEGFPMNFYPYLTLDSLYEAWIPTPLETDEAVEFLTPAEQPILDPCAAGFTGDVAPVTLVENAAAAITDLTLITFTLTTDLVDGVLVDFADTIEITHGAGEYTLVLVDGDDRTATYSIAGTNPLMAETIELPEGWLAVIPADDQPFAYVNVEMMLERDYHPDLTGMVWNGNVASLEPSCDVATETPTPEPTPEPTQEPTQEPTRGGAWDTPSPTPKDEPTETPVEPAGEYDLNEDGAFDSQDVFFFARQLHNPDNLRGDFNADGDITTDDLVAMVGAWEER